MNFSFLDWIIFFCVPFVAWIIGSRSGRKLGTWRGYFLGTGSLSTTSVAAVYFGANLTFTTIFLVLSEEAFYRGAWVFSVPIFWIAGTLFFLQLYPRLKPYFRQGMTLHQALGKEFESPILQRWASVWTIIAFVGTVALEFYGGIRLLQWTSVPLFFDISLALLLAFVVGSFTVSGGFRGVAYADIWLDLVALGGIGVLLVFCLTSWTSPAIFTVFETSVTVQSPSLADNTLFAIAMGIIFIPFQLCTLDTWQRLGAWENRDESPQKWLLGGSVVLALAYCVPILIGIYVRSTGEIVPVSSHVLRVFLDQAHIGPGLLGLVFAGFIAAIFSTADELLNCCGLSLLFDTFQIPRNNSRSEIEEARIVVSGQFYTTLFGFISAAIALLGLRFEKQISDIALAVFSGQVVFVWPLLVAIYFPKLCPRLNGAAVLSMLIAFIAAIALVVVGWVLDDKTYSDGAPLGALVAGGIALGLPFTYVFVRYRGIS